MNRYIRKVNEDYLYVWTEVLSQRPEMIEVDKDGNPVHGKAKTPASSKNKPNKKTPSKMNVGELKSYIEKEFKVDLPASSRKKLMAELKKLKKK